MADPTKSRHGITVCTGKGCEKREECYRYTAQPNPIRQSFFMTPPLKKDGSCDYFWGESDEG